MSVETNAKIHWITACAPDDIDEEDVMRFDHDGASYAVYRIAEGFYASDGWCTHEHAHLADGFVVNREIECPLHQGRFDIRTGAALCAPVTQPIRVYGVQVEGGEIYVDL